MVRIRKGIKRQERREEREGSRDLAHMQELSVLIKPCYDGKSIFDIIQNTSLLEGDVIRFFRQMLDIIGQLKSATYDDELRARLEEINKIITDCLEKIDVIVD